MEDLERLIFSLEASPDADPEFQVHVSQFVTALHQADISYSRRIMVFDSADQAGFALSQFGIPVAQILVPAIAAAVVAWITGRAGRKLKLKVGDVELEANSPAEIDHLLKQVAEFKAKSPKSDKLP